jgi:glycosyltransferase involved in cell wall biosynthesis
MESAKMNKELISVIVPVYNVEKYLANCIESIIHQTYDRLEIILVDDGATDSSGEIADKYAGQDKRIKVLHKKNGGLSDARNAGIKAAKGNFIAFVDSDDWVEPDYINKLFEAAYRTGADITICNYRLVFESGKMKRPKDVIKITRVEQRHKVLKNMLIDGAAYDVVAWNKLYKTKLFTATGILYPKGKINEDNYTTYRLVDAASRVAYIPDSLVNYLQRKGSIMDTLEGQAFLENQQEYMRETVKTLSGKVPNNLVDTYKMLTDYFILRAIKSKCISFPELKRHALSTLRKNILKLLSSKMISRTRKIKILLTALGA